MKGKYKVNYYELIYKIIIIFSLSMLIVKSIIDIIGFKINIYETLSDYINISIIYNVFQIICYFFLTIEYRKKGFKSSISICLLQFTIGLFIDRNTNIITKLIILCGIFIILSITYYYICKSYKRERELYNLAFTDSLTNVLNRRGLEMCLKGLVNRNVIRKKDNIAIVFIDLDDFKTVNDTKGHEYGDFILKEAARRWKCVLRKGDYIARYGGDEFILILTNYDCQIDLSEHIYEFFETLNEGFILNESEMNISASFGVALYSEQRCNLEQLLKYADIAMNNAKRKGKRGIDIFDGYINEVEMI